jgi:hypothetical protein
MASKKGMLGMVPGADFLQGLLKAAPAALPPTLTQWIAPTLSVEELDKKIQDLKSVQMWLDSQAKMVQATVQALEVQRMTLSTLKTMKVSMEDVAATVQGKVTGKPVKKRADAAEESLKADPAQWWNALSKNMAQPFLQMASQVASNAMQASTKATAKAVQEAALSTAKAGAKTAAKQTLRTMQTAAEMLPKVVEGVMNAEPAAKRKVAVKKVAVKKVAAKKRSR